MRILPVALGDLAVSLKRHSSGTRPQTSVLLALTVFGACAPAHAQVQAGATLTNVRYQVVDLRPGDGSAAGYWFGSDTTHNILYSQAAAGFGNGRGDPSITSFDRKLHFGAETHAQLHSAGHYSANASFADSVGFQVDATLHGRGRVHTNALHNASYNYGSGAENDSGLRLRPWTALTITADAEAFVEDLGMAFGETTMAFAQVGISWLSLYGQQGSDGQGIMLLTMFDDVAERYSEQQQISLTITNSSDSPWIGSLSLGVAAEVRAVPEPATYGLLLAGLGIVAAWRRHKLSPSTEPQPGGPSAECSGSNRAAGFRRDERVRAAQFTSALGPS